MADFLWQAFLTGGLAGGVGSISAEAAKQASLLLMGTGAAADTVTTARDQGMDSGRAMLLGIVAGISEYLSERHSLETLLNPDRIKDGAFKAIAKNAIAEGSEEVASDLMNWFGDAMLDVILSQSESEWKQKIRYYVSLGVDEHEAFGLAMKDRLIELGMDFVGGVTSGGLMGGGETVIDAHNDYRTGQAYLNRPRGAKAQVTLQGLLDKQIAVGQKLGADTVAGQSAARIGGIMQQGNLDSETKTRLLGQQLRANEMTKAAAVDKNALENANHGAYNQTAQLTPQQQVAAAAETLGESGKAVLVKMYDGKSDATRYTLGMTAIYDAGKSSVTKERLTLSQEAQDAMKAISLQQHEAIFEAGVKDAKQERVSGKSGATQSALETEQAMFEIRQDLLGENAPATFEEFQAIKTSDPAAWKEMNDKFEVWNMYEIDGDASVQTVLDLDRQAWKNKQTAFDKTGFTGSRLRTIKSMKDSGNAAAMQFDGKLFFAHSRANCSTNFIVQSYHGDIPLILVPEHPRFSVLDLGDGIPRQCDTEAKFLEFVAAHKKPTDRFSVTILSEKHICESCQNVVAQFKRQFPYATVTIISGKSSKSKWKTLNFRK